MEQKKKIKKKEIMKNLTLKEFQTIYSDEKNLGNKPIVIDFYADW